MNVKKEKKSSSLKKLFSFTKKNSKEESPRQLSAVQEFPEENNLGFNEDEFPEQSSFIEENEVRDSLQQFSNRLDGRDSIYFDPANLKAAVTAANNTAKEWSNTSETSNDDEDDNSEDFMSANGRDDEDDMNDFLNEDEMIEELDGAIEDEVEAIIALRYSRMEQEEDDQEEEDGDQVDLPMPMPPSYQEQRRVSTEEPAAMFGWGGVQVAVHRKSIQEATTAENTPTRTRSISGTARAPSTANNNFQCSECSACFIDAGDLEAHIKASHGRLDKSVSSSGEGEGDTIVMNSFVCPECMSQFTSGSDLKTHFETVHASPAPTQNNRKTSIAQNGQAKQEGEEEGVPSSGTAKFKARRASLLAAGKSLVKAARSAKAEETILKVSRRVTLAAGGLAHTTAMKQANQAAAAADSEEGGSIGGGQHTAFDVDPEFEVSDNDLLHSFASLLGSLKDPAYLKQFVEEREGVVTLATMADHIVQDAEERARQLGRSNKMKGFLDDDEDEEDFSDSDDEEPEMVLSANEVMLQHCVLKAVLTVLDSEPGLEYILEHEELLASIFTSIQASNQKQHMGKMYAIITSLCYLGDEQGRGKVLFMRCLDAIAEMHPQRPRFDGVCRLLCDADSSWSTKLQAMGTLNTLVIVGGSEEERLDLRAEVGRALTALAVEFDMPLDSLGVSGANRQVLEETYMRPVNSYGEGNSDFDENENIEEEEDIPGFTRHRGELMDLWDQLVELRGGDERGEAALESCLSQCSTLPVLLHLRLLALRVARSLDDDGAGAGSEAEALSFVEKLDFYEKTCIKDRIDIDTALEKLAPSQDIEQEDEVGRAMVLDAKERVVTRLTMMMQELQREAVSMGPLVDSFTTALLDLILVAVNEELTPADNVSNNGSGGMTDKEMGLIRESGEEKSESVPFPVATKKFAQAMSLSDSVALMETVMAIQNLEAAAVQQQHQQQHHHSSRKSQWSGGDGGDIDLDAMALDLRPSYLDGSEEDVELNKRGSRLDRKASRAGGFKDDRNSVSGFGGDGKKSNEGRNHHIREEEAQRIAALEEEFKEKVAALEERMNIYKSIAPVPEDEMQWLIESKGQNAYLVAEKKEAETQAKYSEIMGEADLHGMVSRLLKNHPSRRVLDNLGKADFSLLFAPPPPKDSAASSPPAPKFGAPVGGSGGRPDMAAMLGGALAKKQAQQSDEGGESGGRPNLAALFAGKGGKGGGKGGGGGGGMAGLLGGIAGRGGGGGIGGGLAGLKKAKSGSPVTLLNSLRKERDKAITELEATRARGTKVAEAATIVDALTRILDEYEKLETQVKERKLLEDVYAKEKEKYEEKNAELKKMTEEASKLEAAASKAEDVARKALQDVETADQNGADANELENALQFAEDATSKAKELRKEANDASLRKANLIEQKKKEAEESGESLEPPSPLPPFKLDELGIKVGEVVKKEKEFLDTSETNAVKSAADCQKVLDELQTTLEKWAKRKREAPERDAAEAERERKWAEENKADNEVALRVMRSFVPANLSKLTSEEFEVLIEEKGGKYPPALLERLKSKKMLLWVITHSTNIISANFLAGAHKVSFVNLQEYDFIEMRAIYAVLPAYFLLDSTPHHENEKKNWREGFVKTLKDLIVKSQMNLLTDLEARNPAYRYPTLEEANAVKAKWQEGQARIVEEEAKLPELRSTLATARAEYDKITIESREPALREILSKDTLREWVKEAKTEMTKATKALATSEDKLKRMRAEEEKQAETRKKLLACFDWCAENDMYGKPVKPVFDENPTLEVESSAYKKLTDEEEVALRNAEKAALLASRQETAAAAAPTSLNAKEEGGSSGVGSLSSRQRTMSIASRKSISGGNGAAGAFGMRKGAKKDFMALLDSTLSGKQGGGEERNKAMFKRKVKSNEPSSESPSNSPPKPKPKPQVVLKKGASTRLAMLLKSKDSVGSMLSSVVILPEDEEKLQPPKDMSPRSARKGSMMGSRKNGRRTGSVSFAGDDPTDDDGDEDLRNGVSEMADGETRKQAAMSIGENNLNELSSSSHLKSNRSRAASLRPSVGGGGGALSSLMDAASDDFMLEQMRMKNIQDGDSHAMKRVASKAGSDYGKLRRQQSRADLGGGGLSLGTSSNDRFQRMSRTSSFAPQGVARHLTNSGSGGGQHHSSHNLLHQQLQQSIGGFSSNNLRSLSRTASVAGGSSHGLSSRPSKTTFGFRGNPASLHGARVSSIAGESVHSKSMHTFKSRLGSSGSIGGSQDLLSPNNYWSESRPRGQQFPSSKGGLGGGGGGGGGASTPKGRVGFGRNSPPIAGDPNMKIRSRSYAPVGM